MRLTEFHELRRGPVRSGTGRVDARRPRADGLRRPHRRCRPSTTVSIPATCGARCAPTSTCPATSGERLRPGSGGVDDVEAQPESLPPAPSTSSSVSAPHIQSQCADTVCPATGRGASDVPSLRHRTRSSAGSPEPETAVGERQRLRGDHRVVAVRPTRTDAPADPAVLHDLDRLGRVAVQEADPRVDDEDVKAVVRQRLPVGPGRPSSPVTCPANAARSRLSSAIGIDRRPAVGHRPSSCAPPSASSGSVTARRVGDRTQVRPRAVELLRVRGESAALSSRSSTSASAGPQ